MIIAFCFFDCNRKFYSFFRIAKEISVTMTNFFCLCCFCDVQTYVVGHTFMLISYFVLYSYWNVFKINSVKINCKVRRSDCKNDFFADSGIKKGDGHPSPIQISYLFQLSNCFLSDLSKCCESLSIIYSHLSKHLSVNVDVCNFKAVHHFAVG